VHVQCVHSVSGVRVNTHGRASANDQGQIFNIDRVSGSPSPNLQSPVKRVHKQTVARVDPGIAVQFRPCFCEGSQVLTHSEKVVQ